MIGAFTVEFRDRILDEIVEFASNDSTVVAATLVGSTADASEQWFDPDLTWRTC
ncbi:MAG: hypothetical protein ACYCSA_02495 [Thermoplasmataceae archaeon]